MNFDFNVLFTAESLNMLASGLWFTIKLTVMALIGGMLIGTPLAMMRLSSNRILSGFAKLYVDFFRGLPLVQVLLVFYLMLPIAWQQITGAQYPTPLGAGIQSVSKGQMNASYALGMNYAQVMFNVILPQALRNMLPVLLTQTIILFQDITLVYAVGWKDFLGAGSTLAGINNRPTEFYLFVGVVYFIICYLMSSYVKYLQNKIAIVR